MPSKWYETLVMQDSINRKAIQQSNRSWIVINYSSGFHVLDLHNKAKTFDLSSDITENISVTEETNHNAGYLFLRNQEAEKSLIPLLPGYFVFTSAGNNQLLFFWEEFGLDASYSDEYEYVY